jgi:hypothetical protein
MAGRCHGLPWHRYAARLALMTSRGTRSAIFPFTARCPAMILPSACWAVIS